jgi:hypothetical protein
MVGASPGMPRRAKTMLDDLAAHTAALALRRAAN